MVVNNPQSYPRTLQPGEAYTFFNGVRILSNAANTELTLTLSSRINPLDPTPRYRFSWTGGTNPVFRTNRGLTLNTKTVVVSINTNFTVKFLATAGDFAGVSVGDEVFLPSVLSGDAASPFDPLNCGYWVVLGVAVDTSYITVARSGDFEAVAESVLVSANSQVQAYSSAGLQVGDKVDISAVFSASILRTYEVANVTAGWFEVLSNAPIPTLEVAVPTTSGITFFSSCKNFIRIEVDQECAVRFNGDTSDCNRVEPWTAGDKAFVGTNEKKGPVWQLVVKNRSLFPANVTVISAE